MKTNKFLTIAAAALILAACSNDEGFDNLKDTPITVTAGVAELTSRAGYEGTSVLPETFYLSITQDEATTSKYTYTNVLMTKGTDNAYTAPTGTTLLWKSSDRDDVSVNAYTTDATTFTMQTDQSTANGVLASDLLGAVSTTEGDVTITDNNIAIAFRHLLCKLDVTFSWGTELATATTKTIKSVEYRGFGADATLDRATCTITKPEQPTVADIQAYVNGVTSEAIFAPHMGAAPKIVITATINGVDRVFSIGVTAPEGGFASGNRYTMNVTIGGTSVEDESVSATIANGWQAGDANGEADGKTGNMTTN